MQKKQELNKSAITKKIKDGRIKLIDKWDNNLSYNEYNYLFVELYDNGDGWYTLIGDGGANTLLGKYDDDGDYYTSCERTYLINEKEKDIWLSTHNLDRLFYNARENIEEIYAL